MSAEGVRIDEQAAVDVICGVERVASWERLTPQGSQPTPDFRFQLVDGRVADLEVTMYTDGAARSLRHQLSEERDGKGRAGDGRYARNWHFDELSFYWEVVVTDHTPALNAGRSVRRFVDGLKTLFVHIERIDSNPVQMRHRAMAELDHRMLFADDLIETGVERDAFVLKPPEYRGPGQGAIKTHAATTESTTGDTEALREAIADCIDHKAARGQLDRAPGERWLAVVLDRIGAASQMSECFGATASEPYPDLTDLADDRFDQVWVVGKTSPPPSYVAVRLIAMGVRQERHLVPRPETGVASTCG